MFSGCEPVMFPKGISASLLSKEANQLYLGISNETLYIVPCYYTIMECHIIRWQSVSVARLPLWLWQRMLVSMRTVGVGLHLQPGHERGHIGFPPARSWQRTVFGGATSSHQGAPVLMTHIMVRSLVHSASLKCRKWPLGFAVCDEDDHAYILNK